MLVCDAIYQTNGNPEGITLWARKSVFLHMRGLSASKE